VDQCAIEHEERQAPGGALSYIHSELARNLKLLVGQIPEIPRQARNDKSTIFCGFFPNAFALTLRV
jgi:hypothetical protein